jgi:hypothetical protein
MKVEIIRGGHSALADRLDRRLRNAGPQRGFSAISPIDLVGA